ncbi:MAG: hypothetical protein JOS17DRAFT_56466 [Linnemannia elongata]|nr:MAG: hypothetical protein JOS17DRAFT_56466 [Linnemannia elongata]
MDLKLLLSPAQKDPEADSASSRPQTSEDHATTHDRQAWSHPPHDPSQRLQYQQPYPQHHQHPQHPQHQQQQYQQYQQQQPPPPPQHYGASPKQHWQQEQQQQQSPSHHGQQYSQQQQPHPYYQQQQQQEPLQRQEPYPHYSNNEPSNRPQYSGQHPPTPEVPPPAHYDYSQQQQPQQQHYSQQIQQRNTPYGPGHDRVQSRPYDGPQQQHRPERPPGMDSPGSRPLALVPPILSISASTPLAGESPQPPQYFVPTHKPNPPILPPPSGLNLSSYSFLLMEKRDREREALERANQGYLKGVASSSRGEPGSSGSPLQPAAKVPDPKRDDSYYNRHGGSANYPHHPSEGSYGYSHHPGASGSYDRPPHVYDGPPQHYSSGPFQSQPYGPPPPGHHYHSSSSNHFGQDPAYGRPQQHEWKERESA